ncbi:MAG: DUF3500 domain-containing protein [Planctomycetes bacterium]|nr:DUF3500 domain-containing protein [Planctomycetota bacterium]
MKSLKITLAIAALAVVAGIAYVAQQNESAGTNMVSAAEKFVASLNADQKKQAIYDFDSDERFNWHFIPLQDKETRKYTRKGLPLEEMTADQKKAALGLIKAGTSDSGNVAVTTIMSLEAILLEQEGPKSAMVRNPGWYFFTIFGTPSKTGKWGWRVEGHHLSMNFTMQGTQVASATPCFFGANPAQIKDGPNKGKRILPEAEDYALMLFKSLDDGQRKTAHQPKHFEEPGARLKRPKVDKAVGLPAAKMTNAQEDTLIKLLNAYIGRMAPEIAKEELRQVNDAGIAKIHFAFTGSPEPGKGYTYRLQGPTFVCEFLNVQADSSKKKNPANHIHSCWRRLSGDFGL